MSASPVLSFEEGAVNSGPHPLLGLSVYAEAESASSMSTSSASGVGGSCLGGDCSSVFNSWTSVDISRLVTRLEARAGVGDRGDESAGSEPTAPLRRSPNQ